MPLRQRKADSHKGDFGHILVIGGSLRYSGAALLCAEAAMRSGAGLVTVTVPKSLAVSYIKVKLKEVMLLPLSETSQGELSAKSLPEIKKFFSKADILVLGPGLGSGKEAQSLVRKIIKYSDKPTVIDADGLNALAGNLKTLLVTSDTLPVTRILTPHSGEMARLLGKTIDFVQANRKEVAKRFACDYNCIVVLKGKGSIIASPKGEVYVNSTGSAGMATAGSGDVLSGMIAAFLGQGLTGFEAAKYAVYLHGLAGDLAAKEKTQISMIASDIIAKIPEAIKKCC